jgi:hypothetical protein
MILFLDFKSISDYLVSIALEDRALLESNLSAKAVPRHGAPTVIKYCWGFFFDTCFGLNAINSIK